MNFDEALSIVFILFVFATVVIIVFFAGVMFGMSQPVLHTINQTAYCSTNESICTKWVVECSSSIDNNSPMTSRMYVP